MRTIDAIAEDVFNGLGSSLPEDEQLYYAFIYGEADAQARGLSHYMSDKQRAEVLAATTGENLNPPPATQNIMEAEIAPPSDNAPSTQVVGLPLLEIPALSLGGLPEGLLVLASVPEPVVPTAPDTPAEPATPVPEQPVKAIKLPKPVKK